MWINSQFRANVIAALNREFVPNHFYHPVLKLGNQGSIVTENELSILLSVTAPPTVSVPTPQPLQPPPPQSSASSSASQQNRSETPDSACDVRSLPNSADSPSASEKGGSPDISSNVGTETRDVSAAAAAIANDTRQQANTTIATQTDASAAGQSTRELSEYNYLTDRLSSFIDPSDNYLVIPSYLCKVWGVML